MRRTLLKYFARMCTRCTPFGMFAGFNTLSWDNHSKIELKAMSGSKHGRLDMHYLDVLAKILSDDRDIRALLKFYPNKTIYQCGHEIRFIETKFAGTTKRYDIGAVDNTEYLRTIIASAEAARR